MAQFDIQLHQVQEVHTETFPIEADNEKDALKQAEAIVADKGIKRDYKLVVTSAPGEDVAPEAPSLENAPEPEAR